MAILYTDRQIDRVLKELRIEPIDGKVDANEGARILTWRAKNEQGIDYAYKPVALRQHIRYRHFEEGSIDENSRGSRYPVRQVFRLPLAPKRATGRKRAISEQA